MGKSTINGPFSIANCKSLPEGLSGLATWNVHEFLTASRQLLDIWVQYVCRHPPRRSQGTMAEDAGEKVTPRASHAGMIQNAFVRKWGAFDLGYWGYSSIVMIPKMEISKNGGTPIARWFQFTKIARIGATRPGKRSPKKLWKNHHFSWVFFSTI